jgi:hypothetical protein
LLSSAILYVAIVVIWACVLIPRWLRRDSSATAAAAAERASDSASDSASVDSGVEEAPARVPGPAPRRRRQAPRERQSVPDEPVVADRVVFEPVASDRVVSDPGYRRVLAARRRLLIMLLALSVASGVLAGTRMAAWWVIVPPSLMLLGYLLLLREAAKADAERREMARDRLTREAAEGRSAPAARVTPVAAGQAAAGLVAGVAPAAKIIAFLPPPEEQIYDQYTDAKLRAVGD